MEQNLTVNQQISPSENQIIKSALSAPKISMALPYEIDGSISMAIDRAIFYLGLKTLQEDRDMIKINAIDDVKRHFKTLTISEIGIAIDNGVRGLYGPVIGLSPKDIFNWMSAYSKSDERKINLEAVSKEMYAEPEPTDEEKAKLAWANLVNAWESYKANGTFNDFGNSVYNSLLINEKINFTKEQRDEFKKQAELNLLARYNPIKNIGNEIKMNECRGIIAEIKADGNNARLISEAKNIALNQFFKDLLEMDMSIEDLFED